MLPKIMDGSFVRAFILSLGLLNEFVLFYANKETEIPADGETMASGATEFWFHNFLFENSCLQLIFGRCARKP